MKFKTSSIFKTVKCVHDLIVSQFVLVFVFVNMGLSLSLLRIDFYRYRFIASTIISVETSEVKLLKESFCKLPGSNLEKLKQLHAEVSSKINWGGLVLFLRFAKQLGLTEEEWELLFCFLVPTLTQIREQLYQ